MTKKSAGIILFRKKCTPLQVLLVHPGGPFWKNKDAGAWSIPKGEFTDDEDPLEAAKRELQEEIGIICGGPFLELTPVRQKGGKQVFAWASEMDFDPEKIQSNTFQMEWPPKSGQFKNFPEVDKVEWFIPAEAKVKLNAFQACFMDDLIHKLK